MSWELVLAHVLLPSAVAAAAGFGAWRCWRALRQARDPRAMKLMWSYGLLAASLVPMAIWTGQLAAAMGDPFSGLHSGNLHWGFAEASRANIYILPHHALMLASLGVVVQAFGLKRTGRSAVAAVGLAFLGGALGAPVAATIDLKRAYRSRSRLVMALLAAIDDEGPTGVTRLLRVANLTHGKLQELLASFEGNGWVRVDRDGERSRWVLTEKGKRVLADLRRVDAVMQDHGLGL